MTFLILNIYIYKYMDKSFWIFTQIMVFYIFVSYLLMPVIFYYSFGKKLLSAGNGFVIGSILSIILWYIYGSKMLKSSQ